MDRTPLPPGYRHGFSTPVTNGLRLFCDSSLLDSQTPTRVEAYPSPPMSGSPPLPSTAAHEGHLSGSAANFSARFEGSQGRWPTDPLHNDQGTARDRSHGLLPLSRSYPQETPSRSSHIRRLSENILPSVSRYGTQDPRGIFPIPPRHSPGGSAIYGTPNTGHGPLQDPNSSLPRVTSPKSQRKAKGHVASACLPCKRAHLRLVALSLPHEAAVLTQHTRCDGTLLFHKLANCHKLRPSGNSAAIIMRFATQHANKVSQHNGLAHDASVMGKKPAVRTFSTKREADHVSGMSANRGTILLAILFLTNWAADALLVYIHQPVYSTLGKILRNKNRYTRWITPRMIPYREPGSYKEYCLMSNHQDYMDSLKQQQWKSPLHT